MLEVKVITGTHNEDLKPLRMGINKNVLKQFSKLQMNNIDSRKERK